MLKLVPPGVPDFKQAVIERLKQRPRVQGAWQCNRCGSRASMTLESGVMTINGRKQGGTVIEKDICALCWKQGIIISMRPTLKRIE